MYCDDGDALIRCPQFMDMISEFITDAPRSVMADTSVKKVMVAVKENYTQNEKTLFRNVQPLVVKIARDITSQHSDLSNGVETLKKTFREDGLQIIEDCSFIRKLLPSADAVTNNKTIGLTDPKPDLTYGITTAYVRGRVSSPTALICLSLGRPGHALPLLCRRTQICRRRHHQGRTPSHTRWSSPGECAHEVD